MLAVRGVTDAGFGRGIRIFEQKAARILDLHHGIWEGSLEVTTLSSPPVKIPALRRAAA